MGLTCTFRKLHWPRALKRNKHRSPDAPHFVYPALDRSKNQFRVLTLEPGNPGDDITATIATHRLLALPRDYNHELHLSELSAIHEHLSTGANVQLEELLRWECLYAELNELYLMALCRNAALPIKSEETRQLINNNFDRLMGMLDLFVDQVKQHQNKSCGPCEVDAVQILIKRLELILPNSRSRGAWKLDYAPSPKYLAVSYCCGDQTIQEAITLNNVRVNVPASAACALRGIRQQDVEINVWIDALCINPNDQGERTHQVLLMSKIYSSADMTLVWLRSEGKIADTLLSANMSDWGQHCQDYRGSPESLIDKDSDTPESVRTAARNLFTSLLVYLKQPWFSRLWVYQEVLLSQEVSFQVGPVLIPWIFVRTALEYYERLSPAAEWWDGANVSVLGPVAPWCLRKSSYKTSAGLLPRYTPPSLTELLLETIPFYCLDPKDKAYALLGLTSWSTKRKTFPAELKPDYTLSVEECMRNATLAAIGEEMNLECLTLPVWIKRKPTWVVPWHELEIGRNIQPHAAARTHVAQHSLMPDCSLGRKVNMGILRNPNKLDSLFLEGCRFSKISRVYNVVDQQDVGGFSFERKIEKVIQGVKGLLAGQKLRALHEFLLLVLWWRVLDFSVNDKRWSEAMEKDMRPPAGEEDVGDHDALGEQPRHHHHESEDQNDGKRLQRLIERLCAKTHTTRDHESPPGSPPSEWNVSLTEALDWSILNSRFYLATMEPSPDADSTQYMLGYGPKEIEPGDEVILLHGSRAPVILRPEQTWWLLVGPAFPHTLRDTTLVFNSPSPGSCTEIFEIQ
jgi:hypothetical protein